MNKIIFTLLFALFGFHLLIAQGAADFVTTWKTDNPGVSGSTQITIPTAPNTTYNYDVDWDNDGVFDSLGVTGSITHDYGAADTVTIRVRGTFPRICFNFEGDREKILSVDQWGAISWTSLEGAFAGCINLNSLAADAPDLSGVTSMESMFLGCQTFNADIGSWDVSHVHFFNTMFREAFAFNQDIGNWDVSNAYEMGGMFALAFAFNQDIGAWNVSKVGDMGNLFQQATAFDQNLGSWDISSLQYAGNMFINSGLSVANYDSLLIGWSTLDSGEIRIPNDVTFSNSTARYCAGEAARQKLKDDYGWTIEDGGKECIVGTNTLDLIDSALEVFPNPATGLVTIQAGKYGLAGLLRLFDQNGRCVLSRTADQQEVLQLDLSMLPAGLYTLQVIGEAGRAQARVVKQ